MADNPGAYPLGPTTEVGRLRVTIGDVNSVPFDPPQTGVQDYGLFSDAELEVYIAQGGSILRAAGLAYTSLAAKAALAGKSVKDYDLAVDTTKRGDSLFKIAQGFFDLADEEDAGSEQGFQIVPTGQPLGDCWPPELAQWPPRRPWC